VPASAPAAAPIRAAAPRDGTEAALHVLKAALASERARTTELRAEIDALRIALASAEERIGAVRGERDLWAGRARLLADAIAREADDVRAAAHGPVATRDGARPGTGSDNIAA